MCDNCYKQVDEDGTPRFQNPFLLSDENVQKVNAVFDYIEANPDKWDQHEYGHEASQKNCFMGILGRLNGVTTEQDTDGFKYSYWAADLAPILGLNNEVWGSGSLRDRFTYIALYYDVRNEDGSYRHPTLDEMRERVSVALNYNFRKPTNS